MAERVQGRATSGMIEWLRVQRMAHRTIERNPLAALVSMFGLDSEGDSSPSTTSPKEDFYAGIKDYYAGFICLATFGMISFETSTGFADTYGTTPSNTASSAKRFK